MIDFPDYLHLERIRKALWQDREYGSASVMVGAGFSLNAIPLSPTTPRFPNWSTLSRIFVDNLYPNASPDRDQAIRDADSISGSLRIADQFQAAFGRDALETMLLKAIPDGSYKPSYLHALLLRLPWADVLTTNYDTLLEKAASDVTERRYSVIRTTADIPSATRPRIVKLHGSFPSTRPFIITEEDFRTYPRKFAPFVNFAQQTAMENVMCLVGFSGDDPNFLYWTGWVRDHLGQAAPQIYLCGLLNLNTARRNLLHDRNVVPIDLSSVFPRRDWPDTAERHRTALEWFLLNLEQGQPPLQLRWPKIYQTEGTTPSTPRLPSLIDPQHPLTFDEPPHHDQSDKLPLSESLEIAVKVWSKNRALYPGWLIAPAETRNALWNHTEHWRNICEKPEFTELPLSLRFGFLFEIGWRLNRCLVPLTNSLAREIDRVLVESNPFGSVNDLPIGEHAIGKTDVRAAWADLALARFQLAREDQDYDTYTLWQLRLKAIEENVPSVRSRRIYQEILFDLGQAKTDEAQSKLSQWDAAGEDPYWTVRKAGLLAEIGLLDEAVKLCAEGLRDIKSRISTNNADVFLHSREGWALMQFENLKYARDFLSFASRKRAAAFGRWEQLARLKCDPNPEWELIQARLNQKPPQPVDSVREKVDFRGGIRTLHHFDNTYQTRILPAYQAIRLVEEVAFPPVCNHVTISGTVLSAACTWLSAVSPEATAANMLRLRRGDTLGEHFTIARIALLADRNLADYLARANASINTGLTKLAGSPDPASAALDTYISQAATGLDLLAQLLNRSDESTLDSELRRFFELYASPAIKRYPSLAMAFSRYTKSLLRIISEECVNKHLLEFLELPVAGQDNQQYPTHLWLEPFALIEADLLPTARVKDSPRWRAAVEQLVTLAKSLRDETRGRAILRLTRLHEVNLIFDDERSRFAEAIWVEPLQSSGLPREMGLYPHALLDLPQKPKNLARRVLKKMYLGAELAPIVTREKQPDGKTRMSISMGVSKGFLLDDIRRATKNAGFQERDSSNRIDWTELEAFKLFAMVLHWWEAEGHSLITTDTLKPAAFGADVLRERVTSALDMLGHVVVPRIPRKSPITKQIREMFAIILQRFGMLPPMPLFLKLLPELSSEIEASVRRDLVSSDRTQANSAVRALYNWLWIAKAWAVDPPPAALVLELGHIVASRRFPALPQALATLINLSSDRNVGIPEELTVALKVGLDYLLKETAYEDAINNGAEMEEEWVLIRYFAAKLAVTLVQRDQDTDPLYVQWINLIRADPLIHIRRLAELIAK